MHPAREAVAAGAAAGGPRPDRATAARAAVMMLDRGTAGRTTTMTQGAARARAAEDAATRTTRARAVRSIRPAARADKRVRPARRTRFAAEEHARPRAGSAAKGPCAQRPTCASCSPGAARDSVGRRVSRMAIARPGSRAVRGSAIKRRRARRVSLQADGDYWGAATRIPTARKEATARTLAWRPWVPTHLGAKRTKSAWLAAALDVQAVCRTASVPSGRFALRVPVEPARRTASVQRARSAFQGPAKPARPTASAVQALSAWRRMRPQVVRAPSMKIARPAKRVLPASAHGVWRQWRARQRKLEWRKVR
jgi:hypothetical protein